MKKEKHRSVFMGSIALFIFFIFSYAVGRPNSQAGLKPRPLKISDSMVCPGFGNTSRLECVIKLYADSNPVTNAHVRLNGLLDFTNMGNGEFRAAIVPYDLYANRHVEITIRPDLLKPGDEGLVTANGTITDIVEIVSPSWKENIDLASTEFITVRWRFKAGSGPVSLFGIWEGKSREGLPVILRYNVPGDSFSIPRSLFKPNRSYFIVVEKFSKDLSLKGNVTPDSRIPLNFVAMTHMTTFTTIK